MKVSWNLARAKIGRNASLNPIKNSYCLLEQETSHLLLSTGYFQEQIQVWFTLTIDLK